LIPSLIVYITLSIGVKPKVFIYSELRKNHNDLHETG